MRTIK